MTSPSANRLDATRPKVAPIAPPKLMLLAVAMIGAILSSSLLVTGDSVTISDGETLPQILLILITVLIASLAGCRLLTRAKESRLPATLLCIGIVCLILSTQAASLRADGRAAWNNCWHIVSLLLFAMLSAQYACRKDLWRAFMLMVVLCAVFQSTFALFQYFVSMPAARAEYLLDPDATILKARIDAPPGSELRSQFESRLLGSFEPPGTFALTNSLAVLLSGAIVALAVMVLPVLDSQLNKTDVATSNKRNQAESNNTQIPARSLWIARAILVGIICVWVLTKSRSGYLAVAIVACVAIAFARLSKSRSASDKAASALDRLANNKGWMGLAAGALLVIGLAIGLLSSDQLVLSEASKSILYRIEYWQATAKMILDFPLTGVGFGNFQSYYPAYKLPAASEVIADPHNWLFDLAVNGSIPFLITTVIALGWTLQKGVANPNTSAANISKPIASTYTDNSAYPAAFWSGALAMFVATAAIQLVLGELIDFDATVLSAFATLASWWFLNSLPVNASTVRQAAWLATVTMLVCLLSSGSWQASGIALPMALLLALCHGSGPKESSDSSAVDAFDHASGLPSKPSIAWIAIAAVVLGVFIWQTWRPVQNSWALEQQAIEAWRQGRPELAIATTKDAIQADRLALSPRRLLAQFCMDQAVAAAQRRAVGDFLSATNRVDESLNDLLSHAPISNLNHSYAGECNLTLAAACVEWNQEQCSQRVANSVAHYEHAVERYPSSVALRAQLAVAQACLDFGSGSHVSEAATRQLDEARRLSELTPHSNRKLASQQIYLPQPLADRFPSAALVRPSPDSPWAKAEPFCEYLRKL